MKPWDVEETVRDIRGISGAKTIEVGQDLTGAALRLLKDSIRSENPKIKLKDLNQQIEYIIWELRPWIMQVSLKIL